MKKRMFVCLLAVTLATGCAPISRIEPSFGHAAQLSFVTIDDDGPAVNLSDIREPGRESLYIPGNAFYLLPGKYFVHVTCRKPPAGKDSAERAQAAAPDGLDDNYSLTVERGKQYQLDCDTTGKDSHFVLWDVTPA